MRRICHIFVPLMAVLTLLTSPETASAGEPFHPIIFEPVVNVYSWFASWF